jgi:cobalt-zinc-cadmium efflux system outer membrane protein
VKSIYVVAPLALALSIACFGQSEPHSVAAQNTAAVPLSIDEAVAAALDNNPEIRAGVRRLSLAQLKTTTARSLDDPMLMVRDWDTPLRRPWDLNQAQLMVSIQQTFLSREKRDQRARLSEDDAGAAAIDVETLRQQVSAEVRKQGADLMRNADEMRIEERQSSLLKESLAVALAQYSTGKAPQADVLRAQMALTRLDEQLIELEQERDTADAQLNALMGRAPGQAIEIAGSYAVPAALPAMEDLEQVAIEHRPELAAMRTQIAKSKDEGKLTRLAMKPDFTVALGYMLMPTGSLARSAYMGELSMNLPRLNRERHDGEAKQADAAVDVSQAELEMRTTTVFLEIRQAQIEVQAAQKRVKLYRDTLLPQAEASFKASTAAYRNNRAELMSLIDAQNLLLDIQTAYYKASAATDAGMAQLELAIGAPIPAASQSNSERTSK